MPKYLVFSGMTAQPLEKQTNPNTHFSKLISESTGSVSLASGLHQLRSAVHLEIQPPNREPLIVSARAVWMQEITSEEISCPFLLAVEFEDISKDGIMFLSNAVSSELQDKFNVWLQAACEVLSKGTCSSRSTHASEN